MLSFQPKTKSMTFTCFTKLKHRSYVYDMFYVYATIWQPRTAHRWDEKKKKSKDGINDNNRQMTIDRKITDSNIKRLQSLVRIWCKYQKYLVLRIAITIDRKQLQSERKFPEKKHQVTAIDSENLFIKTWECTNIL